MRELKANRSEQGFTLAEVVTVVAIIGVLVAVAIPTFSGLTEMSDRSIDEANINSAKAIAPVQYMKDEVEDNGNVKNGRATYYFDPVAGVLKSAIVDDDGNAIEGYGRSKDTVNGADGVPNPGGSNPKVLSLKVSNEGSTILAQWETVAERSITTTANVSTATEDERVAQDTSLLDALQEELQNMTVGQLAEMLGDVGLNHQDFTIAVTKARAVGQQTTYDGYKIENQYIVAGFIDLFKSIGVDTAKVNAKEEYLLTTAGSGNDVRIKVYIGTFDGRRRDLSNIVAEDPDRKMEKAYVYLDAQDPQDKKFESLYTAERSKTVN